MLDHERGIRRRLSSLGAMRRLRALQALGWSMERAYREFGGPHENTLRDIANGRVPAIRRDTHDAIARLYDLLSMRLPEPCSAVSKLRNAARRKGWKPPLFWDDIDTDPTPNGLHNEDEDDSKDIDHAVVWRVLQGDVLPTNRAERMEIMRRWLASGRSEKSLCNRMGWKDGRYSLGSVGLPGEGAA